MKVAILSTTPFPEGMASTNRVYYHAKGLIENGHQVKVFITVPTEYPGKVVNKKKSGVYKNIPFEYTSKSTVRTKNSSIRKINGILSTLKAIYYVRSRKYDVAFQTSLSFIQILVFKSAFNLMGIKYIIEKTEHPFLGRKHKGIFKLRNVLARKYLLKSIWGFVTISYSLQDCYKKLVSKNSPVILLPVTVDVNEICDKSVERTRNLVYTGPLLQKKDGILTILRSFKNIADEFPDTKLIMTGNLESSADKDKIMQIVNDFKHKDRLEFKGFVSRKEMLELINSAAGLVLAKPSSDQANTCFPTKLGEYLATGNPIVVTRTGEIPIYLEDNRNAFIAEPDSIESFTRKLRELLSDPEKAKQIGRNGQRTAIDKFNYLEISKRLIRLINERKQFE